MIPGRIARLALVLAAVAALGALLAVFAQVRTDLSFVVPRNPSPDAALLAERLQKGPGAGLLLVALTGAEPDALARTSRALAESLRRSDAFHLVANGEIDSLRGELDWLLKQRYLLNPPVAAGDFSAEALRRGLEESLASLSTSYGALTKQTLAADPTGRLRSVLENWAAGSGRQGQAGIWLSADLSKAFLLLWAKGEGFDLDRQEGLLADIAAAFDAVRGETAVAMTLSGPAVFAVGAKDTIQKDTQMLTITSVVLVNTLLLLAFRSLTVLLIILVPLSLGVFAGAFAVQFAFGEIHGITLAFGATLIGVAVDYPIHVISHGAVGPAGAAKASHLWRTLRLGVLTTVAAFLPFLLSNFPGLGQLGLFSAAGLLAAALATRFLLPWILPEPLSAPGGAWLKLEGLLPRLRHLRIPLVLLAGIGLATMFSKEQGIWEADLRNLSPTPKSLRDLDRDLRQEMGAADVRYLLVLRGETADAVLRESETLVPVLEDFRASGAVTGYDFAARYLPSAARQAENQAALPAAPKLETAMAEAVAGLPFRPGLFGPFVEDVARLARQEALALEDLRTAGLGWRVDPLIFQQAGTWVGLIVPRGVRDVEELLDFVRSQEGLSLLDLKTGSEELVAAYRNEALAWLALGGAVALLVLVFGQRSFRRVFRVLLPVLLAVILSSSVLSFSGVAFSLFHLLSMLLVIGVGLDYALFFERNAEDRQARRRTLRANVLCCMTSVTVFAVLALSQVPVLHGIGVTVAVGAVFSLLTAAVYAGWRTV